VKKIYWHEGMLLGPQHLIYNDELLQSILHQKFGQYHIHNWGISELELNSSAITNGIVEILKLNAQFPDGTLVSIPGNACCPVMVLDLETERENANIYLCIAPFTQQISGEQPNPERTAQLLRVTQSESHLTSGDNGYIETSDYNLMLIMAQSPPKEYITIKIGELGISGGIVEVKPYVPPLLKHNASHALTEVLKEIYAMCNQIARSFHNATKNTPPRMMDVNHVALLLLSKFLLSMEMWILGETTHPEKIHKNILFFYGEFYSLLNKRVLSIKESAILKYDHCRILSKLNLLKTKIQSLLDEYSQKVKIVSELRFDGTYFHAKLNPNILKIKRLGVMVSDGKRIFPNKVKIASRQLMPMLIANSISGLQVEPLKNLPLLSEKATNSEFYRLSMEGEIWDSIVRYENLVIFSSAKPQNCKISLVDITGV